MRNERKPKDDFGNDENPKSGKNSENGQEPESEKINLEGFIRSDDFIRGGDNQKFLEALAAIFACSPLEVLNGLQDLAESAPGEDDPDDDPDITVTTVLDTDPQEQVPGHVRNQLSVRYANVPFGSYLCRSLVEDLQQYYEPLLFGLIDDIYLHSTRTHMFSGDCITSSSRIFWSEKKSPYPLVINRSEDIILNKELIYLIVGDLIEDLVNGLENPPVKPKKRRGRRPKAPKKA